MLGFILDVHDWVFTLLAAISPLKISSIRLLIP